MIDDIMPCFYITYDNRSSYIFQKKRRSDRYYNNNKKMAESEIKNNTRKHKLL